jgi:hypothetical protein
VFPGFTLEVAADLLDGPFGMNPANLIEILADLFITAGYIWGW